MFLRRLQAALKRMDLFPLSPEMPYTILISWGTGQKTYSRHPFIFVSLLELEGWYAMAWHYGLLLLGQIHDPMGLGPRGGTHSFPRPIDHPSPPHPLCVYTCTSYFLFSSPWLPKPPPFVFLNQKLAKNPRKWMSSQWARVLRHIIWIINPNKILGSHGIYSLNITGN